MQRRCGVKTSTTSELTRVQREMSKCVDLNSVRLLRKLRMPRAKQEASQCVKGGEIKKNADCMSFYHLSFFSLSHPYLPFTLDPEAQRPAGVEEKLRRPFFYTSISSPSPRSNPTRRRPIKHDSWVGCIILLLTSKVGLYQSQYPQNDSTLG